MVRWARRVGALLLTIAMGASIAAWLWLRGSLPALDGTVEVPGLRHAVEVVRDELGEPTVTASSSEDALFALGYVHAQDRFFQMEMSRRVAGGRVAELVGRPALGLDRKMRTFGLRRAAERSVGALRPATRAALEAYAAGVNAWLAEGRLPPELGLLRLRAGRVIPDAWQPADSVAILKMLSFLLDGNYQEELVTAGVVDKVGRARADALLAPELLDVPTIITAAVDARGAGVAAPITAAQNRSADPTDLDVIAQHQALGRLLGAGRGVGSNSWVLAGSRTTTGKPILSNDPHLAAASPSQWYAVRLAAPGLTVSGMSIAGIPGVIVGRNERIAWGITAMHADVQDLFMERVDPTDSSRYLVGDERLAFVTREETVRVAGEDAPVSLRVRETVHGPVIDDAWHGGPLSLSWGALATDDTSMDGVLGIDAATDWASFRDALRAVVAPVVNFTYADVDGHIGYLGPGRIPVRARGDGSAPTEGWRTDAAWSRYVPFDELPQTIDPAEGFIVSANQRVAGPGYPHLLARTWMPAYRARRIRELILARAKIGMADLPAMHDDVLSLAARALLPRLLAAPTAGPREAAALAVLRGWDGALAGESAPALVFTVWMAELRGRLFADELGEQLASSIGAMDVVERALVDPAGAWCDDVRTPARETCEDQLGSGLTAAVARIAATQGDDPARWRLDRTLVARFSSQVTAGIPILRRLYTREVPGRGDGTTVRAFSFDDRFVATVIPSMFADYDLSRDGEARAGVSLGQSSHPLSPHFDDHLPAWQRSSPPRFLPAGPAAHRLVLTPRR
jgi:penicillin amidase